MKKSFGKKAPRRFLQTAAVLLAVSFITFGLTYLAPGNPATAMFEASGISPSPEMVEQAMKSMGLDRPFLEQYGTWLGKCFRGDFGMSFSKHGPVLPLIVSCLKPTAKLAVLSLFFMVLVSVPLGIYTAVHENKFSDYLIRCLTFFGISMPGFWIGLILLYVFSLKLKLIPILCDVNSWKSVLLPAVTLAIPMASKYIRQVRIAVLEELSQDYVIGAMARGLSRQKIMLCHILPNVFLPLITLLGLSFGSLLGGTAVVEVIFGYRGLGNLAVDAVKAMDYPLIQGIVLWIALIYMVMNLLVDVSYGLADPRVRKGGRG